METSVLRSVPFAAYHTARRSPRPEGFLVLIRKTPTVVPGFFVADEQHPAEGMSVLRAA